MEEVQLTPEISTKSFQFELLSDKNNSYSIKIIQNDNIEIIANQNNVLINKSFGNKYSLEEIRENKYFLQFDTLSEIFEELKERINNNNIIITENGNNLILNISLPSSKNKEFIFELKTINKNNNERFNELTDIIIKLKTEINNLKNEYSQLNDKHKNLEMNDIKQLNNENMKLKKDIDNLKNKETKLINENEQILNELNLLKNKVNSLYNTNSQLNNEINRLKNSETQLKKENTESKKEINELKEKLNMIWSKEKNKIAYSKIIKGNTNYIEKLKNWINPSKKIRTELLYRLSENGDNKSTFHELCDNKGPTLILFHVNDGNIAGIYTPLSWDTTSGWKNDMNTFIFNLNKIKKYKKSTNSSSIYCHSSFGPSTFYFGCWSTNSMKSITYIDNDTNLFYDKGSEILLSNNQENYNLIETEVYKIRFD